MLENDEEEMRKVGELMEFWCLCDFGLGTYFF